jgi:hypothetical protein
MPDEKNSEEPSTQERVEETLDEDLSVQGTEPDDRRDAAVALGTESPVPEGGLCSRRGGGLGFARTGAVARLRVKRDDGRPGIRDDKEPWHDAAGEVSRS